MQIKLAFSLLIIDSIKLIMSKLYLTIIDNSLTKRILQFLLSKKDRAVDNVVNIKRALHWQIQFKQKKEFVKTLKDAYAIIANVLLCVPTLRES